LDGIHNKKRKMKNTINSNMKDTVEVLAANGGVIGLSLSECNEILLFISTSLAIVFTIYKFIKLKNKE
tara:strand:- start:92 stop:295 length:204 start_codon:yes stop_codon:yes gene_type:complete